MAQGSKAFPIKEECTPTSLQTQRAGKKKTQAGEQRKKVWIDLENSPHVPFFKPIIDELTSRGYSVVLTARDCFQVCELADLLKVPYTRIGTHYGKVTLAKFAGLGIRSMQLMPFALRERPDLAISHGSRSMFVVASMLGIPTVTMFDYEHARWPVFFHRSWAMVPELIPDQAIHIDAGRLLKYPGIKEDVYAPSFRPDSTIMQRLGLNGNEVIVTLRPPATEAHYHNPESEQLLDAVFQMVVETPDVKVVLLPRTPKQGDELRKQWPDFFREGRVMIPEHAIDGLDLIWISDVVISGGGTMNRESAALGVPVYSIFRGKTGAVDRYLAQTGRLVLLESRDDVRTRLKLVRRQSKPLPSLGDHGTLRAVVDNVVQILTTTTR